MHECLAVLVRWVALSLVRGRGQAIPRSSVRSAVYWELPLSTSSADRRRLHQDGLARAGRLHLGCREAISILDRTKGTREDDTQVDVCLQVAAGDAFWASPVIQTTNRDRR
ncbi:hypothetical protein CC78DRAFT_586148 [Lojkania enalia]|uniref:Secreted protein n=1 Tax=Lojkania enalia TaxID=147567 RepID=A0A9P4K0J9_9PLEO|nr:hypothetical protein CC78DRAFT_586148 [Didymosphaeria enalia]